MLDPRLAEAGEPASVLLESGCDPPLAAVDHVERHQFVEQDDSVVAGGLPEERFDRRRMVRAAGLLPGGLEAVADGVEFGWQGGQSVGIRARFVHEAISGSRESIGWWYCTATRGRPEVKSCAKATE